MSNGDKVFLWFVGMMLTFIVLLVLMGLLMLALAGPANAATLVVYAQPANLIYHECSVPHYSLTPDVSDASYLYANCEAPDPLTTKPIGIGASPLDEVAIVYPGGDFYSNSCSLVRHVLEYDELIVYVQCGGKQ